MLTKSKISEVWFHVRRIYNHVEYRRYDTCPKYDANPQFQTRQTYNPIWNCAYTGIEEGLIFQAIWFLYFKSLYWLQRIFLDDFLKKLMRRKIRNITDLLKSKIRGAEWNVVGLPIYSDVLLIASMAQKLIYRICS